MVFVNAGSCIYLRKSSLSNQITYCREMVLKTNPAHIYPRMGEWKNVLFGKRDKLLQFITWQMPDAVVLINEEDRIRKKMNSK